MQPHATDQAGVVGGGARRRRPLLASLTTLGVVTGLLGVAGVFAAGSDTATTGENDIQSGELEFPEADIQLATASMGLDPSGTELTVVCNDDWSDDLATGVLVGNVDQGEDYDFEMGTLCLRNAGTAAVDVAWSTFDVVDEELGCSFGEEGGACGEVGELSQHLHIDLGDNLGAQPLCAVGPATTVADAQVPGPLVRLEPGESVGLCTHAIWQGQADSQSDRVLFRILFEALAGDTEPPPVCVDDALEDNDSIAEATPYTGQVSGQICSDDLDVFEFEHTGGGVHALVNYESDEGDLDIRLLDANGVALASADSSNDDDEVTVAPLADGTYYLEVRGYQGDEAAYTVTMTSLPSCVDDDFEENDTLATATPYAEAVSATKCAGDDDFYSYEHPGGRFEVLLDFDAPTVDLDLYLRRADGSPVAQRLGTDTDESIVIEDLAAGSYILRVVDFDPTFSSAPYALTVTPNILVPPPGGEPTG